MAVGTCTAFAAPHGGGGAEHKKLTAPPVVLAFTGVHYFVADPASAKGR